MARRRTSASSVTTLQMLFAVAALLVAAIVMAFLWAPERTAPPPVSEMHYAAPPKPEERSQLPDAPKRDSAKSLAVAVVEPLKAEEGEPGGLFSIQGSVVDGRGGKPLDDARISVTRKLSAEEQAELDAMETSMKNGDDLDAFNVASKETLQTRQAKTDAQGKFLVEVGRPGVYLVKAWRTGYLEGSAETPELSENTPSQPVVVRLSSGAIISGRVTEAGSSKGAAKIQAVVQLELSDKEASGKPMSGPIYTDENGAYEAGGLTPGNYTVTLDLSGTPYQPGKELPFKKVHLDKPDQELKNVNFSVDPAGMVWGYVMTPDRKAMKDSNVLLCSSESIVAQAFSAFMRKAPPLHDVSDENGYYELTGVPLDQEWRIYATAKQFSPQLTEAFLLMKARRSVRMDIFILPGSAILGRVVDADKRPVADAEVRCMPAFSALAAPLDRPHAFKEAKSDDAGAFVIDQVPAGDYQLFAFKKGYKLSMIGEPVYPDGFRDLKGIELTLLPMDSGTHRIFGFVKDGAGAGISNAMLRIEGLGSETFSPVEREANTGPDGAFAIEGVELGMYRMTATADGYGRKEAGRVLLDRENSIVLETAVRIGGRVLVRETNAPAQNYSVRALRLADSGTQTTIAPWTEDSGPQTGNTPEGQFELYVTPGNWRLEATAQGFTAGRQELEVQSGQPVDNLVLYVSSTGGRIAGHIRSSNRSNLQGATAQVVDLSTSEGSIVGMLPPGAAGGTQMQVGGDGAFAFDHLAAGEYRINASHPSYASRQSETITLPEGGNIDNIEVVLGSGGQIQGYVYRQGVGVSGAVIVATGNGSAATAASSADGSYTIDGLSSGTYQVMVTEIGGGAVGGLFDARGNVVEVVEGQISRCDFGAGTGTRIEGLCQPAPPSMLGGIAILRPPGPPPAAIGSSVTMEQLSGQSASISPTGEFLFEGVLQGEWQLDIFYLDLGGTNGMFSARYVQSQPVTTGGQDSIQLDVQVRF